MIKTIKANESACQVDEFYYLVALRDHETNEYIMLQRTRPVGSQDDDGIYLEYNDQINSAYEIIETLKIDPKQVSVQLSNSIDEANEIDGFMIDLDIDIASHNELIKGLKKIFKGKEEALKIQEV